MEYAPRWLRKLVGNVAASADSLQGEAELGCHVFQNEETAEWEVTLFAEPSTWGGRLAQSNGSPVLSVDVYAIVQAFDRVYEFRWQTAVLSANDDLGPHLSIEGECHGHAVWLRVLSEKPAVLSGAESLASFL
ncbi:hypothetical protein GC176_28260 [bacterium]|nr:hypothetical protein [bacterium]